MLNHYNYIDSIYCLAISQVSNVDDVLNLHMNMLNTCLRDCMLTNPELLKTLSKLQSVCILYCNFMQVGTIVDLLLLLPSTAYKRKVLCFPVSHSCNVIILL